MYWPLRLRFAAHLELDATLVAPQQKAATRGMTNAPIAPTPVPYRYCNTKGYSSVCCCCRKAEHPDLQSLEDSDCSMPSTFTAPDPLLGI